MRLLPNFSLQASVNVRFLPSGKFFLRFVPLVPDLPAADQASLALEGLAPFPAGQLYWGCWVAPGRTGALVYAAHRRRLTPAETDQWEQADIAVPDLLPLLGARPAKPTLLIQVGAAHLAGAAWAGGDAPQPVLVQARSFEVTPTEDDRRAFAAELAARSGLAEAAVTFLEGTARARREGDAYVFEWADAAGATVASIAVPRADADALDVRDRTFLEGRQRERRQGEFIWKVFRGGLIAALVAIGFEVGAVGFRVLDGLEQRRAAGQAAVVAKLETAHGLASRIDELTHKRLRFFEMLSAINAPRPKSIQFTRTSSVGRAGLEIEAQTASADDVGAYESALRGLASLDRVEVSGLRTSNGVTTFSLAVNFKPDAVPETGGAQ
jgi:hypothetical protein